MPGILELLAQTWPARLAQDAWSAATLPRDVYQGRVDPLSAEAIGRANSLAGLMLGGGTTSAMVRRLGSESLPAESLATKNLMMYNPPLKPARPFELDYPSGTLSDANGRLLADSEGRPLTGRYIVGRNVVGGSDQGLGQAEFNALTEAATGQLPKSLSPTAARGFFGRTLVSPITGRPLGIELRSNLPPEKAGMVHAHELGHAIDEFAGQIRTRGLSNELKDIYNTLNNPNRSHSNPGEATSWGRPVTPQVFGYKGDEVPREYVVEAIRAYMADPNYLKTVAPKTAAAIRAAVNSHPTLSKIIQFNALAGLAALKGIDSATLPVPPEPAPVFPE
jgi:hypothetical protein